MGSDGIHVKFPDWEVSFPARYDARGIVEYWGLHDAVLAELRRQVPRDEELERRVIENREHYIDDEARCWCGWLNPAPRGTTR
jgi:hypothetical protein